MEVAEKCVGERGYSMMLKVTKPLAYFDDLYPDLGAEGKNFAKATEKAHRDGASHYDVMLANKEAVLSGMNELKERYPASISAWTQLGGYTSIVSIADTIAGDPKLAFYRATVEQKASASQAGVYDAEKDRFFASCNLERGAEQVQTRL